VSEDRQTAVRVARADLEERVRETLEAAGARPVDAAVTARVLVDADVRGHRSHGVGLLPTYLHRIEAGGIAVDATPEWLSEEGVVAVLHARGALGPVAAELAARRTAALAAEHGMAAVAVCGNNHVGMLAAYRRPFAEAGVIGVVMNTSGPSVAPPGGQRATIGNNALCIVVPRAGAGSLVVDLATGVVASGKIREAAREGRSIPPGLLLDADGRETTDPTYIDRGGAVPVFGGHKGLGVSLLIELLVGCLATGHGSAAIKKQRRYPDEPMGCGQLFLGFSPAAFAGADPDAVVRELQDAVAGAYREPPARPWFPEQLEEDATARAEQTGIEIAPDLAALLGVDAATLVSAES
jgi:LDH2 family malate/lactate/ureidoglycolate dehydrogenase